MLSSPNVRESGPGTYGERGHTSTTAWPPCSAQPPGALCPDRGYNLVTRVTDKLLLEVLHPLTTSSLPTTEASGDRVDQSPQMLPPQGRLGTLLLLLLP